MTIQELTEKIRSGIKSGAFTIDDEVMLRDPTVSDGAIEAGTSPWVTLDNVLIVGANDQGLEPGIYLEPEEY